MSDRRYQVFVSSTFRDLQDERREVMQALLEMNCIPAGMELFPASDDGSWQLIQRVIDDSDYYVLIVGGRYGSLHPQGISYTEKEYDYATSLKKPVIAFLHQDPGKIPSKNVDAKPTSIALLQAFREKVEAEHHCRYWTSAPELAGYVIRGLTHEIRIHPAVGWVRADQADPESHAKLETLRTKVAQLQAQLSEADVKLELAQAERPKGIDDLAFGDQTTVINCVVETRSKKVTSESMLFTWNELLALLGPKLDEGCIDSALKTLLTASCKQRIAVLRTNSSPSKLSVNPVDFSRVIYQFEALGYISRYTADNGYYKRIEMRLNEYGREQLISILAERVQ